MLKVSDLNPLSGVRLAGGLGLRAEVGGGAGSGEETANHGLEERVEDDLGTAAEMVSCRFWDELEMTYLVWGRAIHMIRTNLKM
jgi:hypothetical protein